MASWLDWTLLATSAAALIVALLILFWGDDVIGRLRRNRIPRVEVVVFPSGPTQWKWNVSVGIHNDASRPIHVADLWVDIYGKKGYNRVTLTPSIGQIWLEPSGNTRSTLT